MLEKLGSYMQKNETGTFYYTISKNKLKKKKKREVGSIPGLQRSPGGGNGNPLQYSCLESPVDRGARWSKVQRLAELAMTEVT